MKLALLSLLSAGVFSREPEGVSLSEQKLSLRSDIRTTSEIMHLLETALRHKLIAALSEVKEDVLRVILPDVA